TMPAPATMASTDSAPMPLRTRPVTTCNAVMTQDRSIVRPKVRSPAKGGVRIFEGAVALRRNTDRFPWSDGANTPPPVSPARPPAVTVQCQKTVADLQEAAERHDHRCRPAIE